MTIRRHNRIACISALTVLAAGLGMSADCQPSKSKPVPRRLTIVTYNIEGWNGVDDRIVDFLQFQNADIIFLQEATQQPPSSPRIDHAQRIAEQLDMHCVSASTMNLPTTQYCDEAILSRFPLADGTFHAIRKGAGAFAVQATINTGDGPLHVLSVHTHATHRFNPAHIAKTAKTRITQVARLLEIVEGLKGDVIIAGDFNAVPIMAEYGMMTRRWTDFGASDKRMAPTFPSVGPFLRIDYVFGRGAYRSREYRVLTSDLSDHLPVITTIERDEQAERPASPI